MSPIKGMRYKCIECPDYDLCENCNAADHHNEHMMLKVPNPEKLGMMGKCLNMPIPMNFIPQPRHCTRSRNGGTRNLVHLVKNISSSMKDLKNKNESKITYNFTGEEKAGDYINVEVGPVWSHVDYLKRKDTEWANLFEGWALTGHWWTTVAGKMSTVQYKKLKEEKKDEFNTKCFFEGLKEDVGKNDFKSLEKNIDNVIKDKKQFGAVFHNMFTNPRSFFTNVCNVIGDVGKNVPKPADKEEKAEDLKKLIEELNPIAGEANWDQFKTTIEDSFKNKELGEAIIKQAIENPIDLFGGISKIIDNVGKAPKEEEKLNESVDLYEDCKDEEPMVDKKILVNIDDDQIFKSALGEEDFDKFVKAN